MAVNPTRERLADRRRSLLAALGDPQRGLNVVHVAGTNGKGSTVAMLASALFAADHRVGRFTSPDLEGPHERFWLAGETIQPADLAALMAEVTPVAEQVALDFPEFPIFPECPDAPSWKAFDLWCAAAWLWFSRQGTDLVVVEAGMGGRSDATNVFEAPEATLVTAIDLDHTSLLGHDRPSLAREKAGIFRPGVPALSTASGEALAALAAEAERIGAPFTAVSPMSGRPVEGGWDIDLPDGPGRLPLAGRHQLENVALVLAAIGALRERGWSIPDPAIREGLAHVVWPGRLEQILDNGGGSWLLDAAHNPAAVLALVASWNPPDVVVVGVQRSKEAGAMVSALAAAVHGVSTAQADRPMVVVPVPGAESWSVDELSGFTPGPLHAAADVDAALALARTLAPGGRRVVTGSIYLVGAARTRLLRS